MTIRAALTIGALMVSSAAFALGPEDLKGQEITAAQYAELVAAATAVNPPNNGENYVIGFANLARNAPFFTLVEDGIVANGEAAGAKVLVTDNNFDGATALANAESYLRRDVDYVIEFQTDANFGPTIMQKMNAEGINVTAIDIPMPGATFMGANNSRSGFMGGNYIGQAAQAKWGDVVGTDGYLVVGNLPQSGAIPAMRTDGQIAGFLAEFPDFSEDRVITIDTKGTLEEGFRVMSDLIGRIPEGAPIIGLAINDQSILGMLRAVQQADRSDDAIFVGMGADESATMVTEAGFLASVGYFPENYGNYLIPIALMELAGVDVPAAVLVDHVMVTSGTACNFYPESACTEGEEIEYTFRQAQFLDHLADQAKNPLLADYQDLLPKN
ncbi:MAG: sugar ABC transporter substrate-binding protein [Rhizobiales bacterium]|nr:sugar ABC transporter substrate-binding protein [Hyphomicrobiales bacterium]NRB15442.1 sugar ABC transporter substrate-binding protein [Hyphomicrobiales bacterium]